MKTFFCATLIVVLFSVTGCKKTDPAFSGAKVTGAVNYKAGYSDTYSYGSDGNVTSIVRNNGEKKVFTYASDTVVMQYITSASVVASTAVYLLHGQKYADTSYGYIGPAGNCARYSYDSNGQLTQQKNYTQGGVFTSVNDYTLTNKNVTTVAITPAGSSTPLYVNYTYGTNTNSIGNQNFGMGFLGVGSLYVPLTKLLPNDTITYHYQFDASSNVSLMTSYDRTGHQIDSMAYSY